MSYKLNIIRIYKHVHRVGSYKHAANYVIASQIDYTYVLLINYIRQKKNKEHYINIT